MKRVACNNYKTPMRGKTAIQGETIERKVKRMTVEKEPISDAAPIIYTEKKDGVKPEYDIRTDRFDIAMEAMEKVGKIAASEKAKRIEVQKIFEENKKEAKKD